MVDLFGILMEATLATSGAILLVLATRGFVRRWFGTCNAYALWLLVPASLLAVTIPREEVLTVAPQSLAATPLAIELGISGAESPSALSGEKEGSVMISAPAITERKQPRSVMPAEASRPDEGIVGESSSLLSSLSFAEGLLLLWGLGTLLSIAHLAVRQMRLNRSLGPLEQEHRYRLPTYRTLLTNFGPALVGVLRPRLVLPANFETTYADQERGLILAHEERHLHSRDPQINAVAALMACLFWFNPLFRYAVHQLRVDQEIACDHDVIAQEGANKACYAGALLKAQMSGDVVPLGAAWPAQAGNSLHTRITAMKAQALPRSAKIVGSGAVLLAMIILSLGAWHIQPSEKIYLVGDSYSEISDWHASSHAGGAMEQQRGNPNPQPNPQPDTQPFANKHGQQNSLAKPTEKRREKSRDRRRSYEQGQGSAYPSRETDGPSFIDEMKAAGFKGLDVNDLVALKVHGATPEKIAWMKELGVAIEVEDVVQLLIADIEGQDVSDARKFFGQNFSLNDLSSLKNMGGQPGDVKAFRALGIRDIDMRELISLSAMGVTPSFVEALRAEGVEVSDTSELIEAKALGVNVDFIRLAKSKGFEGLSLRKLARLKMADVL